MTNTFSIILTGDILPGFQAGNVAAALAKLLKTTEEKAAGLLLGRETVIKRNVAPDDVDRYIRALSQAGAAVLHRPMPIVPPAPEMALQPKQQPAAPAPAPESPVRPPPSAASELAIVETVICPSCGHSQPKRTLCLKCSCDMPRMQAAKEKEATEPKAPPEPAYWASPRANVEDMDDGESEAPSAIGVSLNGRIGRLRYLAYAWPIMFVGLVAFAIILLTTLRLKASGFLLMLPFFLIFFWMTLRIMVLRLHDLNRSGKWVLALILVSIAASATQSPTLIVMSTVIYWLSTLALMAWPGTVGANDYGLPCGANTFWVKVGAFLIIALWTIGILILLRTPGAGKMILSGAMGKAPAALEQTAGGEASYVEVRVDQEVSGRNIEMAFFGKVHSESDCHTFSDKLKSRLPTSCPNCVVRTMQCKSQLLPRYAMLFDNTPSSLTYMSLASGDQSEREGRIVFWGLSVAESDIVCDSLVARMQQSQKGRVRCIRARAP